MRFITIRKLLLTLLFLTFSVHCATAADIRVFAAVSLKEAMDEQAKKFEASTGNKVLISYGGSNALAKQIEAGAPADIFISADLDWMDYLDTRKLLVTGSRKELLRNSLVLITPSTNKNDLKIAPRFQLSSALGSEKLAMANPDSVPAGKYGKQALEKLEVWSSVENKVARTENVRSALVLVSKGEAMFGIVYRTDALADKNVRIADTFPENSHSPIVYPIATLVESKSENAKALQSYLQSPAAKETWIKYGFRTVQ